MLLAFFSLKALIHCHVLTIGLLSLSCFPFFFFFLVLAIQRGHIWKGNFVGWSSSRLRISRCCRPGGVCCKREFLLTCLILHWINLTTLPSILLSFSLLHTFTHRHCGLKELDGVKALYWDTGQRKSFSFKICSDKPTFRCPQIIILTLTHSHTTHILFTSIR